jgi:DNA-directed RNA polymerase specialized sigma subunit
MTNSQADTGLSLTDAAAQLGISERTVLRRIKDGTIDGRKIGEGRGGVWRVYLSVSDSQPASVSESQTETLDTLGDSQTTDLESVSDSVSDSQTQPAQDMIRMVELVDKLQAQNQQLAGQLGFTQAKLQDAQEEVQQLRLLMAPKDEPAPEPPAQPERQPWWRRLFGQ